MTETISERFSENDDFVVVRRDLPCCLADLEGSFVGRGEFCLQSTYICSVVLFFSTVIAVDRWNGDESGLQDSLFGNGKIFE